MPTEQEVTTTELQSQIRELKSQRNAALDNSVYRAGQITLAEKQIRALKIDFDELTREVAKLEAELEGHKQAGGGDASIN